MARAIITWPAVRYPHLQEIGRAAREEGGRKALAAVTRGRVAYVHGERHDLWWEFSLEASFRWQAHLHRLRHEVYQQRLHRLTRALGLDGLLSREVASLTHAGRALADLAAALLAQPDLLIWEEPFYLLGQADAARAAALVRELHREGMAVVALAAEPPGLDDLEAAALQAPLHLAR
jgi:ABC-type uncharacterized transport system ATPase subunit